MNSSFGRAELSTYVANPLGHGLVVGQEPHQSLLIGDMGLEELFARGIAGLGPFVVAADKVRGERSGVVAVADVEFHRPDW